MKKHRTASAAKTGRTTRYAISVNATNEWAEKPAAMAFELTPYLRQRLRAAHALCVSYDLDQVRLCDNFCCAQSLPVEMGKLEERLTESNAPTRIDLKTFKAICEAPETPTIRGQTYVITPNFMWLTGYDKHDDSCNYESQLINIEQVIGKPRRAHA
jgi:hypothetical protein